MPPKAKGPTPKKKATVTTVTGANATVTTTNTVTEISESVQAPVGPPVSSSTPPQFGTPPLLAQPNLGLLGRARNNIRSSTYRTNLEKIAEQEAMQKAIQQKDQQGVDDEEIARRKQLLFGSNPDPQLSQSQQSNLSNPTKKRKIARLNSEAPSHMMVEYERTGIAQPNLINSSNTPSKSILKKPTSQYIPELGNISEDYQQTQLQQNSSQMSMNQNIETPNKNNNKKSLNLLNQNQIIGNKVEDEKLSIAIKNGSYHVQQNSNHAMNRTPFADRVKASPGGPQSRNVSTAVSEIHNMQQLKSVSESLSEKLSLTPHFGLSNSRSNGSAGKNQSSQTKNLMNQSMQVPGSASKSIKNQIPPGSASKLQVPGSASKQQQVPNSASKISYGASSTSSTPMRERQGDSAINRLFQAEIEKSQQQQQQQLLLSTGKKNSLKRQDSSISNLSMQMSTPRLSQQQQGSPGLMIQGSHGKMMQQQLSTGSRLKKRRKMISEQELNEDCRILFRLFQALDQTLALKTSSQTRLGQTQQGGNLDQQQSQPNTNNLGLGAGTLSRTLMKDLIPSVEGQSGHKLTVSRMRQLKSIIQGMMEFKFTNNFISNYQQQQEVLQHNQMNQSNSNSDSKSGSGQTQTGPDDSLIPKNLRIQKIQTSFSSNQNVGEELIERCQRAAERLYQFSKRNEKVPEGDLMATQNQTGSLNQNNNNVNDNNQDLDKSNASSQSQMRMPRRSLLNELDGIVEEDNEKVQSQSNSNFLQGVQQNLSLSNKTGSCGIVTTTTTVVGTNTVDKSEKSSDVNNITSNPNSVQSSSSSSSSSSSAPVLDNHSQKENTNKNLIESQGNGLLTKKKTLQRFDSHVPNTSTSALKNNNNQGTPAPPESSKSRQGTPAPPLNRTPGSARSNGKVVSSSGRKLSVRQKISHKTTIQPKLKELDVKKQQLSKEVDLLMQMIGIQSLIQTLFDNKKRCSWLLMDEVIDYCVQQKRGTMSHQDVIKCLERFDEEGRTAVGPTATAETAGGGGQGSSQSSDNVSSTTSSDVLNFDPRSFTKNSSQPHPFKDKPWLKIISSDSQSDSSSLKKISLDFTARFSEWREHARERLTIIRQKIEEVEREKDLLYWVD